MFRNIFGGEKNEDGEVVIKISEDELKGIIYIKGPKGNGNDPVIKDAYKKIKEKGITFGLNENLLIEIFENKEYDKEIVIAEGIPSFPTQQGKIKYFFNTNPSLKPIEKKGHLDYKNVKLIQSVAKGDKLCEFSPPVKGTIGKTVTGKILQVEDVKEMGHWTF